MEKISSPEMEVSNSSSVFGEEFNIIKNLSVQKTDQRIPRPPTVVKPAAKQLEQRQDSSTFL